jgi:ribosomal protein S12 methylthiotransferase
VGKDERGVLRTAVHGQRLSQNFRRLPPPLRLLRHSPNQGNPRQPPAAGHHPEAVRLQEAGVQELIIIAQDSTDYGHDMGLKNGLSHLLRQITTAAPDIPWIRLMYAYPGYVTDELIETMATLPQQIALPGHPLAARPPGDAQADAPPGQHRVGLPHHRKAARRHARHRHPHHLHRRLSGRDG